MIIVVSFKILDTGYGKSRFTEVIIEKIHN